MWTYRNGLQNMCCRDCEKNEDQEQLPPEGHTSPARTVKQDEHGKEQNSEDNDIFTFPSETGELCDRNSRATCYGNTHPRPDSEFICFSR